MVLRRLSTSDLEEFQVYRSDSNVGRFQGWSEMSSTDAVTFLSEMSAAAAGAKPEVVCPASDVGS